MAKAKPVTDAPADPAATPEVTDTAHVVTKEAPVEPVTPEVAEVAADAWEKWKSEVDGLTIYNFVN